MAITRVMSRISLSKMCWVLCALILVSPEMNTPATSVPTAAPASRPVALLSPEDATTPTSESKGTERTQSSALGGVAARIDFEDKPTSGTYLITAYTKHSSAFKFKPAQDFHPDRGKTIDSSLKTAWHVAQVLMNETDPGMRQVDSEWPTWAGRVRVGNMDGASGGLMFTLAMLDAMYGHNSAGDLVVAGTGVILSDGRAGYIAGQDAKFTAAQRAGADVFFSSAPLASATEDKYPTVEFATDPSRARDGVSAYLALEDYRAAGETHTGLTIVYVDDVRQVLAYLCGAQLSTSCLLVDSMADDTMHDVRPYSPISSPQADFQPARGI